MLRKSAFGLRMPVPVAVREFVVTLVREKYSDFGPTFAAKKLAEEHDLKVSRETQRK